MKTDNKHFSLVALLVLYGHVTSCHGYKDGAPDTDAVCLDMFPVGHGRDAQFTDPPFELFLSQTVYTEWERVRVTLRAKQGTFKGFMLQARRANCRHEDRQDALGVFQLLPKEPETWSIKLQTCGPIKVNNTVTHNITMHRKEVTVDWYAPGTVLGHIYFVATVVQNQTTFWTTVYSEILRDISNAGQPFICPARMLLDPIAPLPTTSTTSTTSLSSKTEGLSKNAGVIPGPSTAVLFVVILLTLSWSL